MVAIDKKLKKLGIKLSEQLPTYDVPLRLIDPSGFNPNEMDDDTFNRLVQEMEETGIVDAIQLVPAEGGRFRIIGGEHRYHGAETLGWETIPSNVLVDERFVDENLQKLLTVRLNVLRGKLNPEKFTKLYEEMADVYGADQLQALFGFTHTDAWEKLVKGVTDAVEKSGVGGSNLLRELNKRTSKAKTVDDLGVILNQLFQDYGSDLVHSFMVFAYGKKKHIYIMMSEQTQRAMDEIQKWCRKESQDINDVLGPYLEEIPFRLGGGKGA
jgi:hypothetical protein